MENTASSAKAQSKAPATPGQALTFRAAPSSESRRDVNRRHEGKQTIHDGFGPGNNRAKPSLPVFRTPGLLDDSSPAWYQEGNVLLPGAEAKNQGPEEDPSQDDGKNRLPSPVPRPPSPLQWGRLDYRTQAIIMKSLTKFHKKELFALDAACDTLGLYRHEADAFVARHFAEWSKLIAGEIDDTTLVDRGTVHMAHRFMMGQSLPQQAIETVTQMSSKIIRWPQRITTDGPPAPADPFINGGFPSFVPLPSSPLDQRPGGLLNQGQRPQPNAIPPQPRHAGFLKFALIPGMEGTPHGVRFTEIVLPPKTLVRGPRSAYTLQDGGRYVIQYPDWCKDYTNLQLSHFTFVEGRGGVKPIPQQTHGGDAAHSDNSAQKHNSSPLPIHKHTDIPTATSICALKSHGSNTVHQGGGEGDSELVTPEDLQWNRSAPMPSFYEEEQGITSEELARMPTGPVAPTSSSVISRHVSHEPYLTIRLPSQYYVFGPRSQLITFDGNFIRSAPACQLANPKQPCRHGNMPHSVGGVYSFWFSKEIDPVLTPANLAVLPKLPEAVSARFLLPSRYAMYRDGSLMPRATAPGFHELRRMRKTQRIDGAVAEEKTTVDLVDQNGIYLLLNDMAPYRSRVLPVSEKKAEASSSTDEPSSEDEECDEGANDIAAIKSMPHHMQDTMLEARRLIAPYREEFEAGMEKERREELLAEKREYSREKAMALKEAKEEKKRKALQRRTAPSRNVAPVASDATNSSGQHGGSSRTGPGLGMGLVSFNDEVLKRQIESSGSSSSSSDGERTQRKRRKMEKLAEKLDRIPDDDDEDDETFHTSRWGRKITKSTKAQEQQQAPVTRRTAPRAASSVATTTKQAQVPTPASTGRQTAVATPPSHPGAASGDGSPLKKKRGRPRKHPLPEPSQPEASSSTAGTTNTQSSGEASSSNAANTIHCAPGSSLSVKTGQQSRVESSEQASADSGNDT
ncbi:hypothetical protein PG985_004691 [Apiospora marii]|uniref:Uncharacterized protein n=1 Tax=Apiospora marii TaxID=335849 RepID=A0ABR1SBX2_9PEZI